MSHPRILSVGQCGYDQSRLERFLGRQWNAEVISLDYVDQALAELRSKAYDLVLVNRVFDADDSSGLELIRALKADPALASVPVMLISDVAKAQDDAVALGALPGFGKSGMLNAGTQDLLASALGSKVE